MADHPIIFSAPMVHALIAGRKSMMALTFRVIRANIDAPEARAA